MNRRGFVFTCLLLTVFLPSVSPAQTQHQSRIPKIGWLSVRATASDVGRELFTREFRKFGYVDGKNITFERRSADDQLDRLSGLAHELLRLKVDVLLTPGGNGALALKNATRTIPIVFLEPCPILLRLG